MTRPNNLPKSSLVAGILLLATAALARPAEVADYSRDVEPIFHERCYVCHGASQQMSGLRLDDRNAALKGGNSGTVIQPGNSAGSKLVERLTSDKGGFRMPPAGAPLGDGEVAKIRAWIDAGAVWPESAASKPLSDDANRGHWSFRPVQRPELPEVRNSDWVKNPIDLFVLAKLEAEKVEPSPEADKATLARRVYFDLIGLPPTPEQVDDFVNNSRPEAYEELVDRLLRSAHYGETQAISWLDAARYADSDGYERDPLRPYAWRWRDWVINALNGDIPFDQFTIEQLAGDLLPNATVEQRVATGFLRNGIKNREAGVKNEEKRFEETLDRINTVGTVWLGLTVGCAQCHDHKYDPLTQKELYQMFAVFNNAVERDIDAPLPGEIGPYLRAEPEYRGSREKILAENGIAELQAEWQRQIIRAMDDPGVNTDWDYQTTEWRAGNDRPDWKMRARPEQLAPSERDEVTDWFIARPGPVFDKDEKLLARIKEVRKQLNDLKGALPELARAQAMVERDEPVATHIALRGDWRSPGIEVQPGTPAALNELKLTGKPVRVAFAEWLVNGKNPLTARVTVNRLWQDIFGRGLVRTANDFGTQGDRPSHSKLIDWLASEFVQSGWSRKHMIRLMVTSAVYRQSSHNRPELSDRDPENKWLARQNRVRLRAELVRDNALAVSGLLNTEVGGKSVRPPQPEGVGELMYSKKPWVADSGPERYRRGLYIHFQRTAPYPMLVNFDAPSTLVASVRRERSNTPLQALNLMNDPVFLEAAQALAVRVLSEAQTSSARMGRMFRLCLGRDPAVGEAERISAFLESQKELLGKERDSATKLASYVPEGATRLDVAAWTGVARGLMNLDEFITRE